MRYTPYIVIAILAMSGVCSNAMLRAAGVPSSYSSRSYSSTKSSGPRWTDIPESDLGPIETKTLQEFLPELKKLKWSNFFQPDNLQNPKKLRAYFQLGNGGALFKQITKEEYGQEIQSDPSSTKVTMAECDITPKIAARLIKMQNNPGEYWHYEIYVFDEYGDKYLLKVDFKRNNCFVPLPSETKPFSGPQLTINNLEKLRRNESVTSSVTPEQKAQVTAAMPGFTLNNAQQAEIYELCNSSTTIKPTYAEIINARKKVLLYLGKKPDGSLLIEDRSQRYIDMLQKISHVDAEKGSKLNGFEFEKDSDGNLFIICYRRLSDSDSETIKIRMLPSSACLLCTQYNKVRNSSAKIDIFKISGNTDKNIKYYVLFTCTNGSLEIKPITDEDLIPTTTDGGT